MDTANYTRMMNFVSLIQKKPRKNIKYFYFDEGNKFIVDGKRLKLIPIKFDYLNRKDNFYIHANPITKTVMYYAYNIHDLTTGKQEDEEEGYIPWDDVESSLYSFFVLNIKELADTVTPYENSQKDKETISSNHSYNPVISEKKTNDYSTSYSNQQHQYSSYNTSSYKEREAFYDKINTSLKQGRTSAAVDHISEHFAKMTTEKKFEDIDTLLRLIVFDKLNIPTMLEILNSTLPICGSLRDRGIFFNKVKSHIEKIKPTKVEDIMKKYIPEPKKVVS